LIKKVWNFDGKIRTGHCRKRTREATEIKLSYKVILTYLVQKYTTVFHQG